MWRFERFVEIEEGIFALSLETAAASTAEPSPPTKPNWRNFSKTHVVLLVKSPAKPPRTDAA